MSLFVFAVSLGQRFSANADSDTEVTRFFGYAVNGRYLRIYLLEWVGRPAMRFEVLGQFGKLNHRVS